MGMARIYDIIEYGRLRRDMTRTFKYTGWEKTIKLIRLLKKQKVEFTQEYVPASLMKPGAFVVRWGKDI